ncbi:hypothetical protein [Streptomyces flavofungini]|uniref:hypothetical protein n=1 Tax=Streptomyces flavofungini TaxID=68200 RepID=UPI0034DDF03B
MRKIITCGLLAAAALSAATPALAETKVDLGNGLDATSAGNFTADVACGRELPVAPGVGAWLSENTNLCEDDGPIARTVSGVQPMTSQRTVLPL